MIHICIFTEKNLFMRLVYGQIDTTSMLQIKHWFGIILRNLIIDRGIGMITKVGVI